MRILTVGNMHPPHHLGGYELTWHSSVEHLRTLGHEVRVLTTDFRLDRPEASPAEGPDVHRELRWYWHDHDFPRISPLGRVRLERHNSRALDRHLDQFAPDVVAWWALGGMSLSLVERVRRRSIPAVGVVGDLWMTYAPNVDAWMRMVSRRPLRWLAPALERAVGVPTRVDLSEPLWLFNSEWTRRVSLDHFDLPHAEVAHPGIPLELFPPAERPPWGWRLLCVGRIDERKGVDTAIEALDLLPPDATLTVVGSGDEGHLAQLRELAGRRGLDGRVSFEERRREELRNAYAGADALVFPVRWQEPWGLVPLEAMAVGAPVVATGTGGSGEYLADGDNCLLFDPASGAEGLAAAVRRLADDPALRERLRENGAATAARFTESAYNERIATALLSAAHER